MKSTPENPRLSLQPPLRSLTLEELAGIVGELHADHPLSSLLREMGYDPQKHLIILPRSFVEDLIKGVALVEDVLMGLPRCVVVSPHVDVPYVMELPRITGPFQVKAADPPLPHDSL